MWSGTRRPAMLGVITCAGVFAAYMVGSGSAFGYDAAVTMDLFVTVPFRSVLARAGIFTNHPAISLIEHAVWRVTGSADEVVMRVAPAAFGAGAAGLFAWRAGRRWGPAAGLAGAALIALHPMMVVVGRDVRGYSLAVLAIVVMGIAVLELRSRVLFAAALAIGVAAHLYAAVPAAVLAAALLLTGRLDRTWVGAGVLGGVAGGSLYLFMLDDMGRGGRHFRADFPIDASWDLLGSRVIAVLAFALVLVVAGWTAMRSDHRAVIGGCTIVCVAGIVVPWLIAPVDLYTRFVFWAIPLLALTASWTIARHPGLAPVVAVGVAAMAAPLVGDWTDDRIPNRQLAEHVLPDTCAAGWTSEALAFYAPSTRSDEWDCPTGALLLPGEDAIGTARARQAWPVICWKVEGAELRANTPRDCPAHRGRG